MMLAFYHDYRFQREDRGWMCVNEIELGMRVNPPRLQLIRHGCGSEDAFFETVVGAKRWTGKEALAAGLVTGAYSAEELEEKAFERAAEKAGMRIARNNYGFYKSRTTKG